MRHVTKELRDKWSDEARRLLLWRRIIFAGYHEETNELYIVLSDGTQITPMQDDEGNGPGALFAIDVAGNESILPTL